MFGSSSLNQRWGDVIISSIQSVHPKIFLTSDSKVHFKLRSLLAQSLNNTAREGAAEDDF